MSHHASPAVLQRDRNALARLDLKKSRLVRQLRSETILVLFYLAIGILVFGLHFLPEERENLPKAVASVLGAITFSLAYLQWRAGRQEASFERYYDRLDIANRKFDASMTAEAKDSPEKLKCHLYTMFTFAELDNLEYVLEKYKLGYVRQELAERAVRAFRSRCEDNVRFCHEALLWIGADEGQEKAKGYERSTREIVRHIIRECPACPDPESSGSS